MGEILSQITRIDNNIQNALAKVAAKGVTVSADAGSDELPGLIEQISTGVDLPELDTPGSAADLRTGKQLIDGDGNVVEGSMPTATQATPGIAVSSGGLITASATQSAGYVAAGTKSATKQLTTQAAKTITPSKSTQTAVASGRYTTGAITVEAIPSQYIVPSGTKSITANGTHDVKSYASVNVAVPTEDLNTVLSEQEALITELETALEGKAAGGGPEICTGTIQQTSDPGYDAVVYYTNADFESETLILDGSKTTYTISVPKGAVMVVCDGFSYNRVGIDQILDDGSVEVFFVTGDFSMICDG